MNIGGKIDRKVGGVILCGGQSTRMGLSKAELPFGEELMLQRIVRIVGQVADPLVVVAAAEQNVPPLPAEIIIARDENQDRGPLEGIRAGLKSLSGKADAAFVISCDAPLLKAEFIRRMIDLLGPHDAAVPVEGKFHHPLAAVYRLSVLPVVEELLAADRLRPFFLFEQIDALRVSVEELKQVDPQLDSLKNLNRPEDYFAALAQAGFEPPPEIIEKLRG